MTILLTRNIKYVKYRIKYGLVHEIEEQQSKRGRIRYSKGSEFDVRRNI